jgi:hypothetical protein
MTYSNLKFNQFFFKSQVMRDLLAASNLAFYFQENYLY